MMQSQFTAADLETDALHDIGASPYELELVPNRVVTVSNHAGGAALADFEISFGPTKEGPWFVEDIASTGLETLAAGAVGRFTATRFDRWMRLRAQGTQVGDDLSTITVYINAEPN